MQRKKPNTHRLWGRHPLYKDSWILLHSGPQSELEDEKSIRGTDKRWLFKILPLDTIPTDLDIETEEEQSDATVFSEK